MRQFNGTPGKWEIVQFPDGEPFIRAPRVLPTAHYDIEVYGATDGNYPEEMRKADIVLGAHAKEMYEMLEFLEAAEDNSKVKGLITDLLDRATKRLPEMEVPEKKNFLSGWNPTNPIP